MYQSIIIDLRISSQEFVKLYEGLARDVNAIARDGRRIRFPAQILRPFVTREGIVGSFQLTFDFEMKFQYIDKI
ncbi:MAG: hypothetical protein ACI9Y1_001897 [Lentisphaeria bacterium]|jgi:hypothetical protein